MATYTTLKQVGEVMEAQKAAFWRVYSSTGETLNMNMKQTEANTPEDSFSKLSDFLSELQGDYVTIKVYTKVPNRDKDDKVVAGVQTGQICYTFRVHLSPTGGRAINGNAEISKGYFSEELMELRILKAEMAKDEEIRELKKEIRDAKQGVGGFDMQKEIFGLAKEWFTKEKISSDLNSAANKVAAAKEIASVEPGVVATAIGNIKEVMNGETLGLIEALGYYAKNDPEGFKTNANNIKAGVDAFRIQKEGGQKK